MLEPGEFLASGTERDVYHHPLHLDRVIKLRRERVNVDRNFVEYKFYRSHPLAPTAPIPKIYGWVETTRGRGLETELIADAQGKPCKTLAESVLAGIVSENVVVELLDEFFRNAYDQLFYVYDENPKNFLYRPQSADLIQVDGFGPCRWGIKYHLRSRSSYLQRWKIRKSHKNSIAMLRRMIAKGAAVPSDEQIATGSAADVPAATMRQVA